MWQTVSSKLILIRFCFIQNLKRKWRWHSNNEEIITLNNYNFQCLYVWNFVMETKVLQMLSKFRFKNLFHFLRKKDSTEKCVLFIPYSLFNIWIMLCTAQKLQLAATFIITNDRILFAYLILKGANVFHVLEHMLLVSIEHFTYSCLHRRLILPTISMKAWNPLNQSKLIDDVRRVEDPLITTKSPY